MTLSRRRFLKRMSVLALGGLAAACSSNASTSEPTTLPPAVATTRQPAAATRPAGSAAGQPALATPSPAAAPGSTPARPVAAAEVRGVWLNAPAFDSERARADTLDKLQRANLNTIFLSAYPLNGNGGTSGGKVDRSSFDAFFEHTKQAGYRIHIWLDSLNRKGDFVKGGTSTVDYADPQEWAAHKQWCLDWLAAYPDLDGIHFDNLRASTTGGSIEQASITSIANTLKTAYQAVKDRYPDKLITAFVDNVDPKPLNPGDYIPPWFTEWLAAHPNNPYLFNGKQYRPSNLRTDPISWLKGGYIDAIMPGDYTPSLELWQRRVPSWQSFLGGNLKGVWFGVAWMPVKDSIVYPDGKQYPGGGADPSAVVSQIKYARSQGMQGVVIFQFGKKSLADDPLVTALSVDGPTNGKSAPFKNKAPA
jgi:hypothetical protein